MTAVASAQLHKAVADVWAEEPSLDDVFTRFWTEDEVTYNEPLNDGDAGTEPPFPYCVFTQQPPDTAVRMSGSGTGKFLVQDVPWTFKVYAQNEGSQTAKEVAADVAERILKRFGGHPTEKDGEDPVIANGEVLDASFVRDYGVRVGDNEYMWTIEYSFKIDMPIAAG